ncbi:MAG: SUMF1/EgtB/PvdO family nonheme iron enzyme [Planctomycetaceae bacterium]|jgi:formylglycine-generating enzyme required for sulfatase activity|nr:SUMF1/EgtB/PvdO family nonheme iron enzyme [Planctomycetaceae bacterium]
MKIKQSLNAILIFAITLSYAIINTNANAQSNPQVELTHHVWHENTFGDLRNIVQEKADINLLAFPKAKLVNAINVSDPQYLIDGDVGIYGGIGRVSINGSPSVITYYLGKAQSIKEILLYSGNVDTRSNQDFEIRLANNESNPGKLPAFPAEANFTSGDKIIGPNIGGYLSRFATKNNQPVTGDKKYDWIEFKIWRTYPSKAGSPAKNNNKSDGWTAFLEIQLLADPNDPSIFATEKERQIWKNKFAREKFLEKLNKSVGKDTVAAAKNINSLKLTINNLAKKFPDKYDAKKYKKLYDEFELKLSKIDLENTVNLSAEDYDKIIITLKEFAEFRKEALLANPLLNFDQLLFRRAKNGGLTANWISNAARGKHAYDNALATINPKKPQDEAKTIIENPNNSFVGDINLHWDADKILVTALSKDRTWQVFELNLNNAANTPPEQQLRQITPPIGSDVDNVEGCYVPDGSTIFISTANMMGVPCIDGSSQVGNIYRLEPDGKTIRQLTFEQDQDWCPVLLPNGRILYLRWEYIDTPHYFTRLLFHMNPDGTNQVEYYGSNSYWPNSLFYARPVPDSSTKFAGIVSGHHGTSRAGELVIFDVNKGRQEADGAIQKIPGYEKPVNPVIGDQIVDASFPKFLFPAPLDENYYIVSAKLTNGDQWALYLVDTFDNMLKLREESGYGLFEPTPIIKRPKPPTQPNRVKRESKESNVFVTDTYFGNGLKDVPKGTVKKFRIFAFNYGYRGIGSHDYFGMESCWDARRILGEVPVYEDGSASFIIPANTPLAIQPLDDKGRAVQLMRSWFVGMPGENQACSGCHETQNTGAPTKRTVAMGKSPTPITPFLGKERPFSFKYEVQPVLDRYCVGCHDGSEKHKNIPNFADKSAGHRGFSKSYHALHPFVRRPGPEGDYYILKPMEFHASSSELFQILEKGHYGVKVDADSMRRLYAWVDLNVPYFGTWAEVAERLNRKHVTGVAARATELRALYADIDLNPEVDPYAGVELPENIEFVKPQKVTLNYSAPSIPNWPFDQQTARNMQSKPKQVVKVNNETEIELAWIPAGKFVSGDNGGFADELPRKVAEVKKPFWMMTTEVTNRLYNQFDPKHDSRYIDQWSKDHTHPGYPANKPNQPVIRINWNRAAAFCEWLSVKTGKKFRLPTETEWEWACRAGTSTPMWYGDLKTDFGKFENLADRQTKKFVVRGVNPQPIHNPPDIEAFIPRADAVDDGNMIQQDVGSYEPNFWGLYDMHGSVAEWTSSDYSTTDLRKVVRGGSWRDRPKWSRSGLRRPYEQWQPVFNVGFRVVCEE